ncbi:hypothetical protein O6P43_004691 [Quillaja saponaria]|uniref:DUF295 domain-containing protein n=1 Tax=Quillaja saponaria TaxID=32244 RepID=A0AAD7Q4G6_QUISA|nr:hypothetical protein O6P43_004685 [Quillaja saponaria]KAJ7974651.1 hypothetical protein O6P43_004691 [Quillaja saponaria]
MSRISEYHPSFFPDVFQGKVHKIKLPKLMEQGWLCGCSKAVPANISIGVRSNSIYFQDYYSPVPSMTPSPQMGVFYLDDDLIKRRIPLYPHARAIWIMPNTI